MYIYIYRYIYIYIYIRVHLMPRSSLILPTFFLVRRFDKKMTITKFGEKILMLWYSTITISKMISNVG